MSAGKQDDSGLKVIGAGLPRTGTRSLKYMLEHLLNGPCHHMCEVRPRAEQDGQKIMAALRGDFDQMVEVLQGWVAAVDWPASILWRELAEHYSDAVVVLSHRGSADRWWKSADATVWEVMRDVQNGTMPEAIDGFHALMRKRSGFSDDLAAGEDARARYDAHFAEVVATIPAERLILWEPTDGWLPLCEGLGLPVPDIEPSHANVSTEFKARFKLS